MIIDEILIHFGGAAMLAKALKVSPPAVSQWVNSGDIPPFRAIEIELLTGGKFRAVDIVKGGTK